MSTELGKVIKTEMKNEATEHPGKKTIFVSILLILIGLTGLIVEYYSIRQINNSLSWAVTEGRVTSWSFVKSVKRRGPPTYQPVNFSYNYSVEGKQYSGHRYSFSQARFSFSERQQLEEQFTSRQSWQVYYDPSNPSSSVFVPGFLDYYPTIGTLGLFSFLISFVLIFNPLIARQKQNKQRRKYERRIKALKNDNIPINHENIYNPNIRPDVPM